MKSYFPALHYCCILSFKRIHSLSCLDLVLHFLLYSSLKDQKTPPPNPLPFNLLRISTLIKQLHLVGSRLCLLFI